MRNLWIASTVLAAFFVSPAHADLVNCNGVWTNRACDNTASAARLVENPARERSPQEVALEEKRRLIDALELASLRARRSGALDYDINVTRNICESVKTTLDDCREAVLERQRQINSAVALARSEGQDARAARREEISEEPSSTNVTVIDDRDDLIVVRPGRYRDRPKHRPRIIDDSIENGPDPRSPNLLANKNRITRDRVINGRVHGDRDNRRIDGRIIDNSGDMIPSDVPHGTRGNSGISARFEGD
jgi:hypothetical protein